MILKLWITLVNTGKQSFPKDSVVKVLIVFFDFASWTISNLSFFDFTFISPILFYAFFYGLEPVLIPTFHPISPPKTTPQNPLFQILAPRVFTGKGRRGEAVFQGGGYILIIYFFKSFWKTDTFRLFNPAAPQSLKGSIFHLKKNPPKKMEKKNWGDFFPPKIFGQKNWGDFF